MSWFTRKHINGSVSRSDRFRYKVFLYGLGLFTAVSLLFVAMLNYTIDPLWCFPHAHSFNRYQKGVNDRQLKSNYIAQNNRKYDAILLGNSRSMLIDPKDLLGYRVFNYAMSAMLPSEYEAYLNHAKRINGDFSTIFIGLDFTNSMRTGGISGSEDYIDKSNSPFYRYVMLLSGDTMLLSLENIISSIGQLHNKFIRFDRQNTAHIGIFTEQKRREMVQAQLGEFTTMYTTYRYNTGLAEVYKRLIEKNPHAHFVVFTTPVSQPLFCLIQKLNLQADYERWLREMVRIFGTVYHFEYLHDVARNYSANFLDAHHPYPFVGRYIAHMITGHEAGVPENFGILATSDNIDDLLEEFRMSCNECR